METKMENDMETKMDNDMETAFAASTTAHKPQHGPREAGGWEE